MMIKWTFACKGDMKTVKQSINISPFVKEMISLMQISEGHPGDHVQ